jgi:SAM-dependent methyltransferase
MEKYHCCASCVHFGVMKNDAHVSYKCVRLGYETKPSYKFNCWEPKEAVKKLRAKRNGAKNSLKNPFIAEQNGKAWGPGSFEMAPALVESCGIRAGMRVLEVGGGSGHIAAVLAKHWNVHVVTLEPWADGAEIQARAAELGVAGKVLALKLKAQELPVADNTFDAVISIGTFEMIGDERPTALREIIRVARPGARIGIAEPMRLDQAMPAEMKQLDEEHELGFEQCFSTLQWNMNLFADAGMSFIHGTYFSEASQ